MAGLLTRAGALLGITYESPTQQTRAMPADILPPSRAGQGSVTIDGALGLPAVFRAISIISTAVSQLNLQVWRNGEVLSTPALARRPDPDRPAASFWKRTAISLACTGNAYWLIFRAADNTVSGLEILNPLEIHFYRDKLGHKVWVYRGQEYTSKQIKHLRLLEVPGHEEGLGPIQACKSSLYGGLQLQHYADLWFDGAAVPTGILSTPLELDPEQADEFKRRWHEIQGERGVAVMGKGLTYEPIVLRPADAQFIESRQLSVVDAARMFGIPAHLAMAEVNSNSLTYQNVRDADRTLIIYTLMQYLGEIEQAMTDLLVRGQEAKFDLDDFLRPDPKTQAEIHKTYVDMGVLAKSEVRTDLGVRGEVPSENSDAQNARGIAEMIQKVYLGVGKVITEDEARDLLNRAGAGLTGPLPTPSPAAPQAPSTPSQEEATSGNTDPILE